MTQLDTTLRQLRLSGLGASLSVRLQEASANRLGHAEFLELILQDELNVRLQRHLERRKYIARFNSLKTLEEFDWRFNAKLPKKELFELATCRFIEERADVLFLGPPGLGKTHLAQAIGYEANLQGHGYVRGGIQRPTATSGHWHLEFPVKFDVVAPGKGRFEGFLSMPNHWNLQGHFKEGLF